MLNLRITQSKYSYRPYLYGWIMTKFDGIKGQELLDVEEDPMEITFIFKDNRFLFVKIENGNLVTESVPE